MYYTDLAIREIKCLQRYLSHCPHSRCLTQNWNAETRATSSEQATLGLPVLQESVALTAGGKSPGPPLCSTTQRLQCLRPRNLLELNRLQRQAKACKRQSAFWVQCKKSIPYPKLRLLKLSDPKQDGDSPDFNRETAVWRPPPETHSCQHDQLAALQSRRSSSYVIHLLKTTTPSGTARHEQFK